MRIDGCTVYLEEEDKFIEEKQIEDGWRLATYTTGTGNTVTVNRHFGQIGPIIIGEDGKKVQTDLDHETGTVKEIKNIPSHPKNNPATPELIEAYMEVWEFDPWGSNKDDPDVARSVAGYLSVPEITHAIERCKEAKATQDNN